MIYTVNRTMYRVNRILSVALVIAFPLGAQSNRRCSTGLHCEWGTNSSSPRGIQQSESNSTDRNTHSLQPSTDSTARNPHAVQPERPTVATHAGTVAPGWVELEEGGKWDKAPDGTRFFVAPTNLKIGVGERAQLDLLLNLIHNRSIRGGPFASGDLTVGVKYRLVEDHRILGDFAVLPAVKMPTASSPDAGTGTTD